MRALWKLWREIADFLEGGRYLVTIAGNDQGPQRNIGCKHTSSIAVRNDGRLSRVHRLRREKAYWQGGDWILGDGDLVTKMLYTSEEYMDPKKTLLRQG